MKKIMSRIFSYIIIFTLIVSSFQIMVANAEEVEQSDKPVVINIETDRDKVCVFEAVKYTITITNTSDSIIKHIGAEAVFEDLLPVGRKSILNAGVEKLLPGESIEFCFKAMLKEDSFEVPIWEKSIYNMLKWAYGEVDYETESSLGDNKTIVEKSCEVSFGDTEINQKIVVYYDDNSLDKNPLTVEIFAEKDKYKLWEAVDFKVKITNSSDTIVENINAEVVLNDLLPIDKDSKLDVSAKFLEIGESITFEFRAILAKEVINKEIYNLYVNTIEYIYGSVEVFENNFDDGRCFVQAVQDVDIGKYEAGFCVDVFYGLPMCGQERLLEYNSTEPYVVMDEKDNIPSFIIGKYTGRLIFDENDVIKSLEDVLDIFGMVNPSEEFVLQKSDTYDNKTFYRLQQCYEGIEIYGRNVVVSVDTSTYETTSISCDYEPDINVVTTPIIDETSAINIVNEYLTDVTECRLDSTKIYITEEGPVLSYAVCVMGVYQNTEFYGYVFVNALDGTIIGTENLILTESVVSEANGKRFNVWMNAEDNYELYDASRNIAVFDAKKQNFNKFLDIYGLDLTHGEAPELVTSTNLNQWSSESILMMTNLSKVYDYYKENYGRNSYNDKNGTIIAVINDGLSQGNNGFSRSTIDGNATIIAIGYVTGCSRLDVLAHEFTHSTENVISDLKSGNNQTGALKEAYADIMGEVIEGKMDWMHGTSRNIAEPAKTWNPDSLNAWQINNECHYLSTIISHAAYLMQTDKITDMDELGELWYRSMYYLPESAEFLECRAAVIAAACDMNLETEKIECIQQAFDKVGISNDSYAFFGKTHVIGRVADSDTGESIPGAVITAVKYSGRGRNRFIEAVAETTIDGTFDLQLYGGNYEIIIKTVNYLTASMFKYYESGNIFRDTVYLEDTILLSAGISKVGTLGGVITNAIDGNALSDVTIKFREGYGNTFAEYYKNDADSEVILKTDTNGRYSCDNIRTGYYTMEVSKEGFVTEYYDVFAANSNSICENQNFSINPQLPDGQYRIVLTWGKNPSDLDSHIIGFGDEGGDFHVYYNDKNAYNDEELLANLDVDDTSSYGPETITLLAENNGLYRYYVHNYSGDGSMAWSDAKVMLYKGNSLIGTYNVPFDQGDGRYWTVFELMSGTIININKVGDNIHIRE